MRIISTVLVALDVLGARVCVIFQVIHLYRCTYKSSDVQRIGIGVAINFITEGDVRYLRDIEQFYNTAIKGKYKGV